jgi:predicted permease
MIGNLLADIRYGLRGLRKSPGFAAVAVITLALGIGANTAIFSVVNTVLIQPLPYQGADRLVMLWQSYPSAGFDRLGASPPEYLDYRDRNNVFAGVAGYTDISFNLTGTQQPDRIDAARVTGNLFRLLGVAPFRGRVLLPSDDRIGGPKLAVVSYTLWQREFNSDTEIVGKAIRLDEQPYTVIGVMPPSFRFPFDGTPLSHRAEIWVPMNFTPREIQDRAVSYDVRVLARLKDGVSVAQARTDVQRIAGALIAEYPNIYSGNVKLEATVSPFAADVVGAVRPALLLLLGAVGFVLLIACANVANLTLARASRRSRDIALRSALGAGSLRLVQQILTESLTLALVGGGLGLLLAVTGTTLIATFGPEQITRLHDVRIQPVVLLFTASLSAVTGILFGLAPALRATRVNLNEALKQSGRSAGDGRESHRARNTLVVVETCCAVLLLFGAGLLINSFVHVLQAQPGFNPNGVLMARTTFVRNRYPDPRQRRKAQQEILANLKHLPGMQTVGLSVTVPLRDDRSIGFRIEGRDANVFHQAKNDLVSNEYFDAMGIPMLQGRTFTDQDQPDSPLVAIVNQKLAREFWPGESAMGKRLLWGDRLFTVIGVAGDVRLSGLDADPESTIYMSTFQVESGMSFQAVFAIRTLGDPGALVSSVRNVIWSSDKDLPFYDVMPMTAVVAESLAQRRFTMSLLVSFAAIALVMAAIGLYGVVSYSVVQRTRELGIRIALGATSQRIVFMVLRESSMLVLAGIGCGLAAAAALTRFMSSLLFGVKPRDPMTFAAAAFVLGLVALAAGYLPALRATKVDPMIALRQE